MIKKIRDSFFYYSEEIIIRVKNHHIESFSSQIAFFMLLSIFPFLIILFMFITNLSVGYSEQVETIYRLIPAEAADIIRDYLEYSNGLTEDSILSPLVVISILLSSNAMTALMKAFNIAYNVTETRKFLHRKLIGILCTLMTVLLIVSALIIPNIGTVFMTYLRKYMDVPDVDIQLFNLMNNILAAVVFIFVLGSLYFILPNKKVNMFDVIPGTIFSFFGLVFISYLFSYFVQEYSKYSLVYGGLAAVIILMMWLFLCGLILMLGGEINSMRLEKANSK